MVFDLLVVRLIAVLSMTSTGQFYLIHPLSSMILSWYVDWQCLGNVTQK